MGTVISPNAQAMSDPESEDEDELVDGIPWEEHRRYYDALPWYALPVANLFSDAYLGAWSGISLVLFAMKFFAVAAATNATVAALVLCVSVLTALLWFGAFVLVGSEDHRALYREMPFGKLAQTVWVGAIACPLGVYAVRAVIGAAMTLVPFFATPEEVLYGGGGDYEDAYADAGEAENSAGGTSPEAGNAVLAAFAVAYLAAGLAEELAKYFGVAALPHLAVGAQRGRNEPRDTNRNRNLETGTDAAGFFKASTRRVRVPRRGVVRARRQPRGSPCTWRSWWASGFRSRRTSSTARTCTRRRPRGASRGTSRCSATSP